MKIAQQESSSKFRKGYLVVGVDPHKKRHAAVAMPQDFTTHSKFKFNNSREGFGVALKRARVEMVRTGSRGVIFAIETGGHYWRNLAYFLDGRGIPFHFINQFTLKRRREGKDLNHGKNDYAELRATYNAYHRLVKERTRITNLVKGLLDGLSPVFTQVFKDPCGLTALSVLSICPVPKVIAGMTEEEFIGTIRKGHQGRLMRRKLRTLHYAVRTSIGIEAGAQSVSSEISFLVEKLCLIRRQIRSIDETLVRLVDETEEGKYLLSIIGLSYRQGAKSR